ncbi:MAG: CocE/NonD family hydrolase, partial [Actinomycetes bacterium]
MRRKALVLVVAAATGAIVLGGPGATAPLTSPASGAEPAVIKTSHEIDVVVGPEDDQTCTIVFDLYRPSTATAAAPVPAILTTNGFGGSKDDQAEIGQSFGERGYAVLSYSGLGFGGSDCKITLD